MNNDTNKIYVGSAKNLTIRLSQYYSTKFLNKELSKGNSKIYRSLLDYDYVNFTLYILEYCDSNLLITREQYYIDLLQPEYNICKVAGSTLGYKHTEKTLCKLKNRKFHTETKINIKTGKKYKVSSLLCIINNLLSTGYVIIIINIK